MATTIGNSLVSQTYLSGLSDLMEGLQDPVGSGSRFLTRTAGGFVPFSSALRTAAQVTDPTYRDPQTLTERIQAGIPGLSQNVPPRLTAFGEEAPIRTSPFSPVNVTSSQQTAVDAELERLQMDVGFTGGTIGGVRLSREQRADYQIAAGRVTYELLSSLVQSEAWQGLNDGERGKVIERAITTSRDTVRDPINETVGKVLNSDAFKELTAEQQQEVRQSEALQEMISEFLRRAKESVGAR